MSQIGGGRFLATYLLCGLIGGFSLVSSAAESADSAAAAWLRQAQTRSVALSRKPLEHSFTVLPRQVVQVKGEISLLAPTNRLVNAGIAVFNFYGSGGEEIATAEYPYTSGLKGYYSYLKWQPSTSGSATAFDIEATVPDGTSTVKIRIAQWDRSVDVSLSKFVCRAKNVPDIAKGLFASCLFLLLAVIMFYMVRRSPYVDWTCAKPTFGKCYFAIRCCILLLAVLLAAVFFTEAYVSTTCRPMSFISLFAYLMSMLVISAGVYFATSGRRAYAIPAIMLLCFALHFIVIRLTHSLYSQVMISDYLVAEQCLKSPVVETRHVAFSPYWVNFELLCSFLGKLFSPNLKVIQYLNALCATAAVWPTFKLSEKVAGFKAAVCTSVLMSLSPILSVYGTILTGEYVAAMAYAYALYFIVKTLSGHDCAEMVKSALWSGLFLGLGQMMRPVAILFLGAFALIVVLRAFHGGARSLIVHSVPTGILLCAYLLIANVAQPVVQKIADPLPAYPGTSMVARSLLIGLNPTAKGRLDSEWSRYVTSLDSKDQFSLLKKLVKNHWEEYPALFADKLDFMYSRPDFGWSWYQHTIAPDSVPGWLKDFMCLWNTLVLGLVALGVAGFCLSVLASRPEGGLIGILVSAVIAGFTVLLLLIEVQPRYKMAVYPVFFLMVPYAGVWLKRENVLFAGIAKFFRRTDLANRIKSFVGLRHLEKATPEKTSEPVACMQRSWIVMYRQLIAYGVIGCTGVALDLIAFELLTRLAGVHYQFANLLSVSLGIINNFFWNCYFNFKTRDKIGRRFLSFYSVGLFGWMLSAVCLWLFIEGLRWGTLYSKLVTIMLVTVVQFCLNKFITFKK